MLPKQRRIEREIYPTTPPQKGVRGSFVSISLFPFKGKSKFSFSISKKIAKTATLRNKIRRIGYKTVATHLDKIENNFLVRFSVHSTPKSKENFATDFTKDIENLLIKTAIIKT